MSDIYKTITCVIFVNNKNKEDKVVIELQENTKDTELPKYRILEGVYLYHSDNKIDAEWYINGKIEYYLDIGYKRAKDQ